MLTRLKVSGFKNLVDVDIRFGPFTCIAGANGVGKSNLFDAIRFLGATADRSLMEAAKLVRSESGQASLADVRSIFHRVGDTYADEISFEAEMIVPASGIDGFDQPVIATSTFLRYSLTLGYHKAESSIGHDELEVRSEELKPIHEAYTRDHFFFEQQTAWLKSAVKGRPSGNSIIETKDLGPGQFIVSAVASGISPMPLTVDSTPQPSGYIDHLKARPKRTVLSSDIPAKISEMLLAKQEMQSWHLLQLEPSALRKPDDLSAPAQLGADGLHLPATLYRIAHQSDASYAPYSIDEDRVYCQIANRLSELIGGVRDVRIDRDEGRELLTLKLLDRYGTWHTARALSDGTLRFLALAALAQDTEGSGLVCLEEPENGIHPAQIPTMLRLLQDIAMDTSYPVGPDNPLRQVIINSQSPEVVMQVPEGSLLVAEQWEAVKSGLPYRHVRFSSLPNTWTQKAPDARRPVAIGHLLSYLNPIRPLEGDTYSNGHSTNGTTKESVESPRVIDRSDFQSLLPDITTQIL